MSTSQCHYYFLFIFGAARRASGPSDRSILGNPNSVLPHAQPLVANSSDSTASWVIHSRITCSTNGAPLRRSPYAVISPAPDRKNTNKKKDKSPESRCRLAYANRSVSFSKSWWQLCIECGTSQSGMWEGASSSLLASPIGSGRT